MGAESGQDVTKMLLAWGGGDRAALDKLIPLLKNELHGIARCYMGLENPGHTLQATALVNEAYLRLVHHARARRSDKRGGGLAPVTLDEGLAVSPGVGTDVVALDDALTALSKIDPRKGRAVELRFFGGLSVEETAEVLKISKESVMRDWKLARAWLMRELSR